jgi:hypothetical protein
MLSQLLTVKFWSLFILSSLKFAFGVPAALGIYNFNFAEALLFSFCAGTFGVWFWLYLSKQLFKIIDYFKGQYRGKHPKPKQKIFSKRSRKLASLKARYGLIGIAIITPVFLSIPVGTILAARIYKHDRRHVLMYLVASVAAWSLIFSSIITLLHTTLNISIPVF